jgi:hypothetical protein
MAFLPTAMGLKKDKNVGLNPPWVFWFIRFCFLKEILCTPAREKHQQQL